MNVVIAQENIPELCGSLWGTIDLIINYRLYEIVQKYVDQWTKTLKSEFQFVSVPT